MLIQLLFATTLHFALTVFSAFVFLATGLLYLDAWQINTHKKTFLLRAIGFMMLSLVAAIHATALENAQLILTSQVIHGIGLLLILVSLIAEPMIRSTHQKPLRALFFIPFIMPVFSLSLMPLSAVFMLCIAATYWRKATEGLEKQLTPACIAFLFLGFSEILHIPFFWSDTPVIFWSKILSDYGILWNIQHSVEFVGVVILALWVWGYIRFRLHVQLFVSIIALSLILFLTTTVFYTFLLLANLEHDALSHLKTDVNVLQYALLGVKEKTLAHAQTVAHDARMQHAVKTQDKLLLYTLATDYMINQKTTSLVIASTSGEVLMRAEDNERTNDTVGNNPIVKNAAIGTEQATTIYEDGVMSPVVSVLAAVPIRQLTESGESTDTILGVVMTSIVIDSAFVDGVKSVTELDVTVFGGNKRAATTFLAPDGKSRFVGTLETNKKVLDTVLTKGEIYTGSTHVFNLPFYAAVAPLETHENTIIGMLFIGKLQNTLTDAAKKSIDLTFLGSVVLMILMLIPAYFLSRYLTEHQKA